MRILTFLQKHIVERSALNTDRWLLFTLLYLFIMSQLGACASVPGLQDYTTLPPPDRVQAKIVDEQIEVSWMMPRLPGSRDISDFRVFISEHTLMYAAFDALPAPAQILPKRSRLTVFAIPDSAKTIFIHMRSSNGHGDLSLPSLPEIRLTLPQRTK